MAIRSAVMALLGGKGGGGSTEIETANISFLSRDKGTVARVVVAQLRLKQLVVYNRYACFCVARVVVAQLRLKHHRVLRRE